MSSFDPRHDLTHEPQPTVVRRLEVITDVGGRRKWSVDAKAEIMLEALAPGATVSEVARRHDLRPQQVFGWLREARRYRVDVKRSRNPPSMRGAFGVAQRIGGGWTASCVR